jgi:hypothetical protein
MNFSTVYSADRGSTGVQLLAVLRTLAVAIAVLLLNVGVLSGQETNQVGKLSVPNQPLVTSQPADITLEAAVAAARDQAKLLHNVYSTTLDVMHHRYFRRDGPVLPARAMEDIFEEMSSISGSYANWISVNTKAMSVNHEPKTDFEKKAAVELSGGKKEFEFVGKGVYRRAAAIPLRSSCVGCHTEMFSQSVKTGRVAGLVISIPISAQKKE